MAEENATACQQSATYEGKEYEVVREGLAEILKPQGTTEHNGDGPKSQTVFYNPIQQINRDLSVLAIRAFAEDLAIVWRRRKERASGKAKHRGNKRKRPHVDEGQDDATPGGKLQNASLDGEQQMNGMPPEPVEHSNSVEDGAPTGKSFFRPRLTALRHVATSKPWLLIEFTNLKT